MSEIDMASLVVAPAAHVDAATESEPGRWAKDDGLVRRALRGQLSCAAGPPTVMRIPSCSNSTIAQGSTVTRASSIVKDSVMRCGLSTAALAAALARRFPGLRGYTRPNLFRMQQFFEVRRVTLV